MFEVLWNWPGVKLRFPLFQVDFRTKVLQFNIYSSHFLCLETHLLRNLVHAMARTLMCFMKNAICQPGQFSRGFVIHQKYFYIYHCQIKRSRDILIHQIHFSYAYYISFCHTRIGTTYQPCSFVYAGELQSKTVTVCIFENDVKNSTKDREEKHCLCVCGVHVCGCLYVRERSQYNTRSRGSHHFGFRLGAHSVHTITTTLSPHLRLKANIYHWHVEKFCINSYDVIFTTIAIFVLYWCQMWRILVETVIWNRVNYNMLVKIKKALLDWQEFFEAWIE